ncbi:MAG: helical backbone metal receptor [Chitinispirillaceae bacterium]|jgi:iron complex transport system substrate-binding protein
MKKIIVFAISILVVSGILFRPLPANTPADSSGNSTNKSYCRIVSLAPSVTEILFDLGLGGRVIGVTRYCSYPPEATHKTIVGGYYDPNYEEIVRLQPDLVIMLTAHTAAREHLRMLGIHTLAVDHTGIAGIMGSITTIGNACGAGQAANRLVNDIAARMARIRNLTTGLARPRVMISVDRNADMFTECYIAGKNTFYDEMISLAGGVNAYTGAAAAYPVVSIEGMYQLNPRIIIDLLPGRAGKKQSRDSILAQWNSVATIEAVRNRRVYVFEQDYSVIPGPRFIDVLEAMTRAVHPELEWK